MFEPAKISDILYGIANSRDQELDLFQLMTTTAIYPSKCLKSNILHLLSDIASVTSVTSFLKFLYNKYIHLHPNVFLLRKFCILITLITQMYYIHLRYSWNSYNSCSTKNYQLCKQCLKFILAQAAWKGQRPSPM